MNSHNCETAVARFSSTLRKPLGTAYRASAFENRAFSENAQGQRDEAIRDYTEALRIDPKLSYAYGARGYAIDTLAAACAEKGNFDLALSYENEAVGCDNVTKASNVEMEKRRALYLAHMAFHKQTAR